MTITNILKRIVAASVLGLTGITSSYAELVQSTSINRPEILPVPPRHVSVVQLGCQVDNTGLTEVYFDVAPARMDSKTVNALQDIGGGSCAGIIAKLATLGYILRGLTPTGDIINYDFFMFNRKPLPLVDK